MRELHRKFLNPARNTKERRGLRLMQEWLSPDQRQQFDQFGYFDVVGCISGRLYRIYYNSMPTNVYEINRAGPPPEGRLLCSCRCAREGRCHACPEDCALTKKVR